VEEMRGAVLETSGRISVIPKRGSWRRVTHRFTGMERSHARDDRRIKLDRMSEQGVDPFRYESTGVLPVDEIHAAHADLERGRKETDDATARRAGWRRGRGKESGLPRPVERSGRIQLHARAEVLGEESVEALVLGVVDTGR